MLVETEDQVEPLAVVTTDLRLNESRYAALPNIMKAKKKPLDKKTPTDFGIDTAPRLKILKTEEPSAARPACYKQERENTIMAILLFFWQITTTLTFPTRRPRR